LSPLKEKGEKERKRKEGRGRWGKQNQLSARPDIRGIIDVQC